jgi:hypothetical protein
MIDFRDLIMEATETLREIMQEVSLDVAAPQIDQQLKKTWATMQPELKNKLATERPEEYDALMKHIGGT